MLVSLWHILERTSHSFSKRIMNFLRKFIFERSLATYRREVVVAGLIAQSEAMKIVRAGPLPWGWLAANGGQTSTTAAFGRWWQLRTLGNTFPTMSCPWCHLATRCSREHLRHSCPTFEERCWTRRVQPEEAFNFPSDDQWLVATLTAIAPLAAAI